MNIVIKAIQTKISKFFMRGMEINLASYEIQIEFFFQKRSPIIFPLNFAFQNLSSFLSFLGFSFCLSFYFYLRIFKVFLTFLLCFLFSFSLYSYWKKDEKHFYVLQCEGILNIRKRRPFITIPIIKHKFKVDILFDSLFLCENDFQTGGKKFKNV